MKWIALSKPCFGKRLFMAMGLVLSLGLVTPVPQAWADDWGALLKPLVQDVLIPGAKMGVQKWKEHHDKNKPSGIDNQSNDTTHSSDWGVPSPSGESAEGFPTYSGDAPPTEDGPTNGSSDPVPEVPPPPPPPPGA